MLPSRHWYTADCLSVPVGASTPIDPTEKLIGRDVVYSRIFCTNPLVPRLPWHATFLLSLTCWGIMSIDRCVHMYMTIVLHDNVSKSIGRIPSGKMLLKQVHFHQMKMLPN